MHCAINLTYLIQDPEILQVFSTSLTEVVSAIKIKIPADAGLLLEKQQRTFKKKRLAKLNLKMKRDNSSTHLPNLPKQQKRTHPYSSRVGSKAEMMKKCTRNYVALVGINRYNEEHYKIYLHTFWYYV